MTSRISRIERGTKETKISIKLNIDGVGESKINTGINFLNHLLETFSKHGLFDIKIEIEGDLQLGQHHTLEDCGIVLGQAFNKAIGDKKGINRAGYFAFPMDDSLSIVAVDISGRPYLEFDVVFSKEKVSDLESDLLKEFFRGFATNLNANIHIKTPYGENDHHKMESIFKAFGKSMKMACSTDSRVIEDIPSTKGII